MILPVILIIAAFVGVFAVDGVQANMNAKPIECTVEKLTTEASRRYVQGPCTDGSRLYLQARFGFSNAKEGETFACKRKWSFFFSIVPPWDGGDFTSKCKKKRS